MGEAYPLDRVIKKVDNKTRANAEDEKLVIIDRITGKGKRSIFARDLEYFIVSNNKNDSNYAESIFEYQIKDFETELNLVFTVKYQVHCEPGNEVQVAEVLWDNTHPGAELERLIKKFISDFFNYKDDVASIIKNSSEVMKKLRQFVTEKVEKDICLNARLGISLGQENDLENSNTSLISPYFPVKLLDYPEPLDLKFELELSCTGEVILPYTVEKLKKTVQEKIKKYLFDKSSAEEFFGELNTTLRQRIISYLNDELASFGRQVVNLSLTSGVTQGLVEPSFQTYCEVPWQIQEEQIKIKSRVLMVLDSVGKYGMRGYPNLQRWFEKNLYSVVQFALFNKNYIDILDDFSSVEDEIEEAIKEQVKTIGYIIQKFTFELDIKKYEVEHFFDLQYQVSCLAKQDTVKINNHVQMILDSSGKYIKAGSPDLKTWVENNLEVVVKQVLFSKNYTDILMHFTPIQEEIKSKVENLAKDIGYSVQHIASIPDMKALELRKYFSIEVKGEDFETKQSGVIVGLSIIVDAKIEDLKQIEGLISSQIDVKDEIQKAIYRVTRSFLHTVEPERFYMRFFHTDDDHKEESYSLEREIGRIIKEELQSDPFYATVKNVTPKPLETEITKRYKELQGKICPFVFEVETVKGGGSTKFRGNIQVNAVNKDMWSLFQSQVSNLKDIKSSFEEHMKVQLHTTGLGALQYRERKDREQLEYAFNQWGSDYIKNTFGLEISVTNVARDLTGLDRIETKERDIALKVKEKQLEQMSREIFAPFEESERNFKLGESIRAQVNEATESRLSELLKMRKTLALTGGNEEEIKNIDREIHDIENMASSSMPKAIEKFMELETLDSKASFSEIVEKEGLFDRKDPEPSQNKELRRIQLEEVNDE